MGRQSVALRFRAGGHVGGLGLGLFGAEVASALTLRIVAVQLTNPFRELVALEALNALVA